MVALRAYRSLLLLATVLATLVVAPAVSRAAAPLGSLSQLSTPFNCVGEEGFHVPEIGCGTLLPVGAINSSYEAVVSPDGKNVYSVAINGALVEYARNQSTGSLAEIGCVTAAAKAEPCATGAAEAHAEMEVAAIANPAAIALSPNGTSVYVVTQGTGNALVEFSRNAETGLLHKEGCITHESSLAGCSTVEAKGLNVPYGIAASPDGKSVYVASYSDEAVAEFERNTSTGKLTQLGSGNNCITSGTKALTGCETEGAFGLERAIGVVVSPDGKNVYIAAGATNGEGAVVAFERNTSTGALTQLPGSEGCISTANAKCAHGVAIDGPEDIVISPDGRNVYTNSNQNNAVLEFKREASGALTQLAAPNACLMKAPTEPACTEATGLERALGVAISPGGEDVYASSSFEDDEAEFARNVGTGALTAFPAPYECIGKTGKNTCGTSGATGIAGARRVTVSPDGVNLYVAGQNDHAIVELTRTVKPTVSRIDLKRGSPSGGEQVYIKGSGFAEGAKVLFGVEESTSVTVHSASSIVAISPAGTEGQIPVKVENAVGASAETSADEFTYTDAPAVAGVSAAIGSEAGGTSVKITGSELAGATAVRFGGTPATAFKVESAETIVATTPSGTGTVDITVKTPHGTSAAGAADKFTYIHGTATSGSGLVLSAYCESLGDQAVTLEREESGGLGFAYDNWACVANNGAETLIADTGVAPSMEDACEHEDGGTGFYGYPEDPNNAFSWGCYKVTPPQEATGGGNGGGPFSKLPSEQIVPIVSSAPAVPPPVLARTGNVAPVSGTVLVKLPGANTFVPLQSLRQIPFGSVIDATNGTVSVTTALPGGKTQTGQFFNGEFVLRQGPNGLVVAELTGGNFSVCPTKRERAHIARVSSAQARAAASGKHVVRKLWANAHGKFSTKGNYAAGAVQGTEWLTEDLCEGTLIRVTRDKVAVTNLVKHKHVVVKTGHRYLAKAP